MAAPSVPVDVYAAGMARLARTPALLPTSVALFGVGVLAIMIIFGLYAIGWHNLPVWLNVIAMLAPLGLITGVIGVIRQTRNETR